MRTTWYKKIILFVIVIVGVVVPFVPHLTIFEMFYLLIPFALIFIATLTYLIISVFNKHLNIRKAIFFFSLLPTFILSQLSSGYIVDKIQRLRSQKIIAKVEEHKAITGELPEKLNIPLGIKYFRMNDKGGYLISYSRGFMVTEKYYPNDKRWISYGWND